MRGRNGARSWYRVRPNSSYPTPRVRVSTLPSTGTPFWRSCVPRGRAADAPCALPGRGFELVGTPQAFSEPRLPQSALDNQMNAHIGLLIRDAALGVLEHRIRTRSPS